MFRYRPRKLEAMNRIYASLYLARTCSPVIMVVRR